MENPSSWVCILISSTALTVLISSAWHEINPGYRGYERKVGKNMEKQPDSFEFLLSYLLFHSSNFSIEKWFK
jgi:hypothetical protein